MRERDTAWISLAHKQRPAVVIEMQPDLVRVAYGTTEIREYPNVVVHLESRQGRAFPLVETIYFYGANTSWARREELRPGHARCAMELLFAIRKVIENYDATIAPL